MAERYARIRNIATGPGPLAIRPWDDLLLLATLSLPALYLLNLARAHLPFDIRTPTLHLPAVTLLPPLNVRWPYVGLLVQLTTAAVRCLAPLIVLFNVLSRLVASLVRLGLRVRAWRDRCVVATELASLEALWGNEQAMGEWAGRLRPNVPLHAQLPWPVPGLRYELVADLNATNAADVRDVEIREDMVRAFVALQLDRVCGGDLAARVERFGRWSRMWGVHKIARCFSAAPAFDQRVTLSLARKISRLMRRLEMEAEVERASA